MLAGTRELPVKEWPRFLEGVTNRMKDWRIRIELLGLEIGDQPIANLPLSEITLVTKGTGRGDVAVVLVAEDSLPTHIIDHPNRLFVQSNGDGSPRVIDFEADGERTLIHFE